MYTLDFRTELDAEGGSQPGVRVPMMVGLPGSAALPRTPRQERGRTRPGMGQLTKFQRSATWWACQDSNLEPRDSRYPAVSGGCGLSLHPRHMPVGCGTL